MYFQDIKFQKHPTLPNGVQALLDFGKIQLSIVRTKYSYGGEKGLYEAGLLNDEGMMHLKGIWHHKDTVQGWLTESDVEELVDKVCEKTKQTPKIVKIRSAFK
jgi:hypothetical protein